MRVVIAEDSVLLREGLTRLLAEEQIEVVAAVADAESLLREVATHQPDVCIVDVRLPPTFTSEGVRAALVIRARWPDVGILVLSQYVEQRYASDLISGESRGTGYLLKDRVAYVEQFVDALRSIADGGIVLDPDVVSQLLARPRQASLLASLTRRERDVLAGMAAGRSNGGIAADLVIGEPAVEKHITNIFAKLNLSVDGGDHRRVLAVLRYLEM